MQPIDLQKSSCFELRLGSAAGAMAEQEGKEDWIPTLNALFKAKTQSVFDRKDIDSRSKVTILSRFR